MLTVTQWVILGIEIPLIALVIVGLWRRRKLRRCLFFGLYLLSVLIPDVVIALRPRTFTWGFWLGRELVQTVVKLGIVVELVVRGLQAFRGARATAWAILLIIAAATGLGVAAAPLFVHDPEVLSKVVMPRLLTGTAWLFGALLALTFWYRLPLDPLHRAILVGFVPYLLLFTIAIKVLEIAGWEAAAYLASYGYSFAYVILLTYWAMVAWRRDPAPPAPPELVKRFHPWRSELQ